MEILEYRSCDLEVLKRLHTLQGFDYQFPDLDDPIHVAKLVAHPSPPEADAPQAQNGEGWGTPTMALIARATAEMYLLVEKTRGTPLERWENFLALHARMEKRLFELGAAEVHAFIPPQVERAFGRRLEKLGWFREPWACYTKLLRIPKGERSEVRGPTSDFRLPTS